MRSNRTELVFILDRSGSMQGLEADTMGGFNAMLKEHQGREGACRVTTVLFDDRYELLNDRENLQRVLPLTAAQYYVRGTTALLDAMGRTIERFGSLQKHLEPSHRADKVVLVIITDGMENASREYSYSHVKQLVQRQQERFGWEFMFLGANIDAIATAGQMGIRADRAANYHADAEGLPLVYSAISDTVARMRAGRQVDSDWKAPVEQDYHSRKGR